MIGDELTLGDYAAVLRRRLAVVVLLFLASVLLAAVWSLSSTPMYRSTARVLLDQADASDAFDSVFFNVWKNMSWWSKDELVLICELNTGRLHARREGVANLGANPPQSFDE